MTIVLVSSLANSTDIDRIHPRCQWKRLHDWNWLPTAGVYQKSGGKSDRLRPSNNRVSQDEMFVAIIWPYAVLASRHSERVFKNT